MVMRQLRRLVDFVFNPPLTAPRSTLLMRIMAGGVFLSEGILKFVYANQGVGRFTKLGFPAPELTAHFVGTLEIVGGLAAAPASAAQRGLLGGDA
jgi:putative oxidoreductase